MFASCNLISNIGKLSFSVLYCVLVAAFLEISAAGAMRQRSVQQLGSQVDRGTNTAVMQVMQNMLLLELSTATML